MRDERGVSILVDIHGHSVKNNSFMYGCGMIFSLIMTHLHMRVHARSRISVRKPQGNLRMFWSLSTDAEHWNGGQNHPSRAPPRPFHSRIFPAQVYAHQPATGRRDTKNR